MKVYTDIPQGTAEWNALRSGRPTASQAHRIITPGLKPCGESVHEKYLFQLLAERLRLKPATEQPRAFWWAERGKELEKDAVGFYELVHHVESRPITFVLASNGRYGASPDRFCDPSGMAEFKCENDADHLMYVMQDGTLYKEHKLQVQMQLLVCEDREWCDLVAYHPELPQAVHRTHRDTEVQTVLRDNLARFCDRLDALWDECIRRGYVDQAEEKRPEYSQDNLIKAMRDSLVEIKK